MKINISSIGNKTRVFLGGTCEGLDWRSKLIIPRLTIDYFNPVVEDWDEKAQENELRERETCDYVLYLITNDIRGVYSIAEVIDDSNKRPDRTVFCFHGPFDQKLEKSLNAVGDMVERNGGTWCRSIEETVNFLNRKS